MPGSQRVKYVTCLIIVMLTCYCLNVMLTLRPLHDMTSLTELKCYMLYQLMSIEEEKLLDINENEIFSPLSLVVDVEPLMGCILSIRYSLQLLSELEILFQIFI